MIMAALDDLLSDIFGETRPAFYAEFEAWVRQSSRFQAFAGDYRTKIRAKLKNARDDEAMADVRAELETASQLLQEKRFTLEYERYAALKQRGPDFTVTFKTHTPFNVEVRRIRNLELEGAERDVRTGKLMAVLCDKVGQMPPSIANLLWLSDGNVLTAEDLSGAALTLLQLAERKDEASFMRCGFKGATHYLKQYSQLSAIMLPRPGENVLWLNAVARHQLLSPIMTALQRLSSDRLHLS
jgi:hypothetical protein